MDVKTHSMMLRFSWFYFCEAQKSLMLSLSGDLSLNHGIGIKSWFHWFQGFFKKSVPSSKQQECFPSNFAPDMLGDECDVCTQKESCAVWAHRGSHEDKGNCQLELPAVQAGQSRLRRAEGPFLRMQWLKNKGRERERSKTNGSRDWIDAKTTTAVGRFTRLCPWANIYMTEHHANT